MSHEVITLNASALASFVAEITVCAMLHQQRQQLRVACLRYYAVGVMGGIEVTR